MSWDDVNSIAAWAALGLALVLGVLLLVQTSRLGRIERQYKALMRGSGAGTSAGTSAGSPLLSIGELVAGQGARLDRAHDDLAALRKKVAEMDIALGQSVQHVGLVRYNPFQETGGDQSFAVALLDSKGDGIVVSSLHSRTMTRFYARPIKGGTAQLSLSEEEAKAVQQAMEK